MMTLVAGAATDVGLVRDHNEDSMVVGERVVAVADGMGGHAAGEVASRLAVDRMATLDTIAGRHDLTVDDVRAAIDDANEDILASARQHPERAGMGTTVTGIAVVVVAGSDCWAVFNVGDSRVYRYCAGELTQLSVDHSEVEELVAAGMLTREQAATYFRRHVVTRSLGSGPAPVADIWVVPPTPGERFVICSDGLTLEVADEQIAEILAGTPGSQLAADALVKRAVAAGGRDNATVVVLDPVLDPAVVTDVVTDSESAVDSVSGG